MTSPEENVPGVGSLLISWALEYDTQKIVHIKNKTIGFLNRLIQLAIVAYVIGYAIIYKKAYQSTDTVISSVTTKLKGVSYTNISGLPDLNIKDTTPYDRIWDVSDYVVPPQQSNAFFVMTNMIITPNQQRGQCPEDPRVPNVGCTPAKESQDCVKGEPVINGNGVRTGKCVPYYYPNGTETYTCEIEAWCPVEYDVNPTQSEPVLKDAKRFTVLIKNTATYPKFHFSKRNILESSNKSYLSGCMYNNETDPFCPIFKLGDIVAATGEDFNKLAYSGGVIGISINWDCNLDYSWKDCTPLYTFSRIDNSEAKLAKGYNFRFSNYYQNETGIDTRTLFKAYGILFEVIVTGTAGKFDFVPLMLNIGTGLALLTMSTVACDIIVCYIMKGHEYYKKKKYLTVKPDAEVNVDYEGETQSLLREVSS
ncbi:P2X purinoceptor 4-like isoform X2 [Acanthaster planci]|uniref:P2X purinoceptor 4-like isoform X2 n=1 Tax=Acanthaster planci TaxID=133434 RepID=A0A8B7ZS91_ACAPL|nr:P2X purinoceptor 4-like isoform X2 [Acanthaster planci]